MSVQQADLFDLPLPAASFDHVFVCFVLEHLARPVAALQALERVPKPGFEAVRVSPRMVYVDDSKRGLVEGFTRKTFNAMVEGVRESAITSGLANASDFDRGIADRYRAAEPGGVFCYTLF